MMPKDNMELGPPLTFNLPSSVEPYRHDIRRFVDAMIYKLDRHSKKGRWDDRPIEDNFPLLNGEVAELAEAVAEGNVINILLEAADVGNYALIIASTAVERGK